MMLPEVIYHGSSLPSRIPGDEVDVDLARHVEDLFKRGLRGRETHGTATHRNRPSIPDVLYLSGSFPIIYARDNAFSRRVPTCIVYEIETESLDRNRLMPDEDFLSHGDRVRGMANADSGRQAPLTIEDLRRKKSQWEASYAHSGLLAYDGEVGLRHVRRILLFARKSQFLGSTIGDHQSFVPSVGVADIALDRKYHGMLLRGLFASEPIVDLEIAFKMPNWVRESRNRADLVDDFSKQFDALHNTRRILERPADDQWDESDLLRRFEEFEAENPLPLPPKLPPGFEDNPEDYDKWRKRQDDEPPPVWR